MTLLMPFVAVAYFVDEQNLEWWVETDTVKTIRKSEVRGI